MKQYYNFIDKFMVRIPFVPDDERKYIYDEDEIIELCKDKVFREQVLVSSKDLYDVMLRFEDICKTMPKKKKNNFIESITEYHIRLRTRTTPFGLFVSVGMGTFDKENKCSYDTGCVYKKVRADSAWLFQLIKKIELECPPELEYQINDAVRVKGNRIIMQYTIDEKLDELTMRRTPAFDIVEEYSRENVTLASILKKLQEKYSDVPEEQMLEFLRQLIEKGVLISNLRPPFTSKNQLGYFIERLSNVSPQYEDIVLKLRQIEKMCKEYEKTEIGEGEQLYLDIVDRMAELEKSKFYLQVDLGNGNKEIKLRYQYAQDISQTISLLTYMSNSVKEQHSYLDDYRNIFLEKFGNDREVPILDMLDQDSGIGAPPHYNKPANKFQMQTSELKLYNKKLKDYFLMKYTYALQNHEPIEIFEDEIKQICGDEVPLEEMPDSMDIYFIPKMTKEGIRLYLSTSIGATSAGKTLGRFTYLSEDMCSVVKDITEKRQQIFGENKILCGINFLPESARSGNVAQGVSYMEKELVFYTNSEKSETDILHMEDILVGIRDEKFYVRDKRSGKQLIFDTGNMFNPALTSNAIHFLQQVATEGMRNWDIVPWEQVFASFKYLPKIVYKNIVLCGARWELNAQDLEMGNNCTEEEFKKFFLKICHKYHIPKKFYISENDNRLKLDVESDYSIHILYHTFKQKGKTVRLEEIEEGEDFMMDQNGKKYPAEVVLNLINKNVIPVKEDIKKVAEASIADRMKIPFDEWLFFKLYVVPDRENELIGLIIHDYMQALKQRYEFDYFFMRYMDPKPHIRLRLHASREILVSIYQEIFPWLQKLITGKICGDVCLATYEREVERYGGSKLIPYAEEVFFQDSYAIGQILKLMRMKQINEFSEEEVAIASMLLYLDQFGLSYEEQEYFLKFQFYNTDYLSAFKKNKERYMKIFDLENEWGYLNASEEGRTILALLNLRRDAVAAYADKMSGFDEILKYSMIASVMHLDCNRLLGVDRKKESEVMCMCERIFNGKKYVLMHRKKGDPILRGQMSE